MNALVVSLALLTPALADRPDRIVADFEGDDYAGWVATGDAFGERPARGTLPGQMDVAGFVGRGLVNSFRGGDAATGTLTSPPFLIERRFLNFLIGGGAQPGKTALELVVDGKTARSATGPNDKPGGTERLDWASWDVSEFQGSRAVLRVVDAATGGWGHINVDQIVQSDAKRGASPVARDLAIAGRYLRVPVSGKAPVRRIKVSAGPTLLHEFEAKLAEGAPDFWVFADLAGATGRTARVETVLPDGSTALDAIETADTPVAEPGRLYREPGRPRYHFTSRRGWLNDPNGLVYFDGEYHLFYQHNPYGWDWGNMHWGHAVSPDLVRWTELGDAIRPRAFGDWAFSGSAVVDAANTSGFGRVGRPALVAAFTSTGRGECIVYSNDRGRTWAEYEGNPVVRHAGRDPRLLWHAPTRRWVMAVYDETNDARDVAFYTSPDLKAWTFASKIGGFFECPDLVEMPVTGRPQATRWVLYGADGAYLVGDFDGRTFTPDAPAEKRRVWYGDVYAAQTFSDAPGGRRIQIGWARDVTFPGMPFNQQMTVPCDLTLRETTDGLRLCALPVPELPTLATDARSWTDPAADFDAGGFAGDAFEARAEAEVGRDGTLTLDVGGHPVVFDARRGLLKAGKHEAPLAPPADGPLRLVVLVDRGSIEVFADGGRVAISTGIPPGDAPRPLRVRATGGARVRKLSVSRLTSAWEPAAGPERP